MQGSDISTEGLRTVNASELRRQLSASTRRPLVKRLWESYQQDLSEALEAYTGELIDQDQLHSYLDRLIPIMTSLRDGGKLAKALDRAQVVILDRVMDGISN